MPKQFSPYDNMKNRQVPTGQAAPSPAPRPAPYAAPTQPTPPPAAKELQEDYVALAEQVMRSLGQADRFDPSLMRFEITTSQLRRILALAMDIYNAESMSNLTLISDKTASKLLHIRVQLVYSAGREKAVKEFVTRSNLLEYLHGAGKNRQKLLNWIHYLEALVAYHRYLGGKD